MPYAPHKSDKKLFIVSQPDELMKFLISQMPTKSRNAIKSHLAHFQVRVNNEIATKFNHPLQIGNTVTISNEISIPKPKLKGLTIVHEDDFLIVVEKDAGLLTMATEKGGDITAYSQLRDFVKSEGAENKIFIVHRLDKDTSGLMVFAKSEEVKVWMQENWDDIVSERNYVAVVEGVVEKEEGTVQSYLKENGVLLVFSSPKPNGGKLAITHYRTLKSNSEYSLLELALETGRKNQIRVHMQDLGHPVVGDKKYGGTHNAIGRLALHAWKLAFIHPDTQEELRFESPIPRKFKELV
ncbi:MAG: RluA family pseudouridine synthase [Cytophagales bacterium]